MGEIAKKGSHFWESGNPHQTVIPKPFMNIRIFRTTIPALALCLMLKASYGQGIVIVQHTGATDPTTEGFALLSGGSPAVGPVTGDYGRSAWSIRNSNLDVALYSSNLTAQQASDAINLGWNLSLTLRVLKPITSAQGVLASFATGTEFYSLRFGAQTNGDPMVRVTSSEGSPTLLLAGAGPGYHNYTLAHDAATGLASLWVDGVPQLAGLSGVANPTIASLAWGGGQQATPEAAANWNQVSLRVVPEPSQAALICLGALFIAARNFRVSGRQCSNRQEL